MKLTSQEIEKQIIELEAVRCTKKTMTQTEKNFKLEGLERLYKATKLKEDTTYVTEYLQPGVLVSKKNNPNVFGSVVSVDLDSLSVWVAWQPSFLYQFSPVTPISCNFSILKPYSSISNFDITDAGLCFPGSNRILDFLPYLYLAYETPECSHLRDWIKNKFNSIYGQIFEYFSNVRYKDDTYKFVNIEKDDEGFFYPILVKKGCTSETKLDKGMDRFNIMTPGYSNKWIGMRAAV